MAPTFASSEFIFHETENKNNKKRPLSGSFRNSVTLDSFLLHFINIHLLSLLRKILNAEKNAAKTLWVIKWSYIKIIRTQAVSCCNLLNAALIYM